ESAKQYEILARSGVRIAKISMNSVLGLPLTSETTVVIQERKNNEKIPQINDLLKTAYENRPDWISFKLAEQTADAGINVAYSGFLPTFTLSGSYGRNIVKYPEEYQDSNSNLLSWKALITGSWTLFDGLNTPNKVYEAQANLDYTKAQGKIMNDAVALDVTSTYYELTSNIERAASARSAEEMSRKMMKLAEMNFEQKIYSTIQLMDAQTVYQKARTDMIAAENDLELSKIKLSRSVGKDLWTASNPKK
ncbi:MAG: TolC family protein, partial [Candidatus Saganbacteria bacterium]|nr:TolC family protein [Candidatus Saganbacteria bacterium]